MIGTYSFEFVSATSIPFVVTWPMRVGRLTWFGSLILGFCLFASPVAASGFVGHPGPVAVDSAGHAWVGLSGAHGVIELDPASGRVIRSVSGATYGFNDPVAVALVGKEVWVASVGFTGSRGNSSAARLTEFLASSGTLVRTMNLKRHGIQGLSELVASGTTLWVSASGGSVVAAIDTRTGRLIRSIVTGTPVGNSEPSGVELSDGRVIYVDQSYGAISIRDATTGRLLRQLSPTVMSQPPGLGYKVRTLIGPILLQITPTDIWAACEASRHAASASVIEIDRHSGRVLRLFDALSNDLYSPQQMASDGRHLFVLSGAVGTRYGMRGASLTEIDESNGTTVRVVKFFPLEGKYIDPTGLALDGSRILVTDGARRILILNAATGRVERVVS
jgi:hypothetical protein